MTAPTSSAEVSFSGRILFLTKSPELLAVQLQGHDLDWSPHIKLRDDISTDEITPLYTMYQFGEAQLGEHPYTGLQTAGKCEVTRGSVRNGGFTVCVSGLKRGKGSSREHAPFAELAAGIRLVIAESFERIYLENCQNLGLFTSTDFGLIARIRRGDWIPIDELTRNADEITREVIRHRGLFYFNMARLQGKVHLPALRTSQRPMTLGERILARHFVVEGPPRRVGVEAVAPGDAGFVRADRRVSHDYITAMAETMFKKYLGKNARVAEPQSVLLFRDHLTFLDEAITAERKREGLLNAALALKTQQERFAQEQGIRLHGELADRKGSQAINHNRLLEAYAEPGQFVMSADSHASHAGAIGCLAVGVGTTAMASSWLSPELRVVVPDTVRVRINGRRGTNVTAKDFMLYLLRLRYVKSGQMVGKIVEYVGEAVTALGIDERATLTNMAVELGAYSAIVPPDSVTAAYLVGQRHMAPETVERLCQAAFSDADAVYAHSIDVDASVIEPMVALPGDTSNGVFVSGVSDTPIDIAFGGSCTASKIADMDMYAEVFRSALMKGRGVHPRVQCIVQAGSQEVSEHCRVSGHLETFRRAGVRFLEPGCGACCNAGPGVSTSPEQVTVTSISRNFPGRLGPGPVFLASPYTVAASAVAGKIAAYLGATAM